MEDLPEELTIDILSRLPVKTIIHCKLVCNKWRNLILESSFVNLHHSRSPTGLIVHDRCRISKVTGNLNLFTYPGILKWVEIEDKIDHHHLHHDPLMSLDLSSAPIFQNTRMRQVGSVNGLICLWQCSLEHDNTYICNPVTREYMILPKQPYDRDRNATKVYGFGVSSVTGEYKVVRVFQDILPNVLESEVYTLGTCQWRRVKGVPYWVHGSKMFNSPYPFFGPYLNGHCHWLVSDQHAPEKLCSFDLDKETFQLFPSPPEAIQGIEYHDRSLGVLKGCLCQLDIYDSQFTIWVMKEYGVKKSWHKEVVIKQGFSFDLECISSLMVGNTLVGVDDIPVYPDSIHGVSMWRYSDHGSAFGKRNLNFVWFRTLMDPSMEDLPEELTIDILSRLPVKTIIHCKRVCKKWRNLVSDSSFVNLHLSRSPTGLIISRYAFMCRSNYCLFSSYPGTMKWVEIEDKVDHHRLYHDRLLSLNLNLAPILQNTWILHMGSVNGLICLWRSVLDNTYICNPVTREYMILPGQHFKRDGFEKAACGFGVNSLTGEYKVVWTFQAKVVQNGHKPARTSVIEAEVYTLGTGQWRSLGPVPVTYDWLINRLHKFHGTFLNNHFHWVVSDSKDTHDKIATFDLDKETFQLFPSPPEFVQGKQCYGQSLGILKGCLCKLDTYHSELTIWVMKEYGIKNSWHKEVVITRETCIDLKWPLFAPIDLIVGLKDGSMLMVFESKLCVFDPRSQTIEETKTFEPHSRGLAYRPSFLKLQNFESEMVHMF
ncbi:hypothetical protein OSB04_015812 [Centaurea solstitialis]|uniref:F-box domain-containing protein n=1 Tax=Centaurea solstitialis TaxID=347529 RepID=A0AA38W7V2_9ASTR|nr:hypothetical protein OSB04_015812 [Centaurea solstitialis]